MSCRYPHYVHYWELVPKVFEANAEDDAEALEDFSDEFQGKRVQFRFVSTDPDRREQK